MLLRRQPTRRRQAREHPPGVPGHLHVLLTTGVAGHDLQSAVNPRLTILGRLVRCCCRSWRRASTARGCSCGPQLRRRCLTRLPPRRRPGGVASPSYRRRRVALALRRRAGGARSASPTAPRRSAGWSGRWPSSRRREDGRAHRGESVPMGLARRRPGGAGRRPADPRVVARRARSTSDDLRAGVEGRTTRASRSCARRRSRSRPMVFVLWAERHEVFGARAEEAGGPDPADFQRTVSQGIDERLLRWKGIEATEKAGGLAEHEDRDRRRGEGRPARDPRRAVASRGRRDDATPPSRPRATLRARPARNARPFPAGDLPMKLHAGRARGRLRRPRPRVAPRAEPRARPARDLRLRHLRRGRRRDRDLRPRDASGVRGERARGLGRRARPRRSRASDPHPHDRRQPPRRLGEQRGRGARGSWRWRSRRRSRPIPGSWPSTPPATTGSSAPPPSAPCPTWSPSPPTARRVLVANEGEPSAYEEVDGVAPVDPEGSVEHRRHRPRVCAPSVRTADFRRFNGRREALVKAGVRIFGPGATVAQDLEPEFIAVSGDEGLRHAPGEQRPRHRRPRPRAGEEHRAARHQGPLAGRQRPRPERPGRRDRHRELARQGHVPARRDRRLSTSADGPTWSPPTRATPATTTASPRRSGSGPPRTCSTPPPSRTRATSRRPTRSAA